MRPPPTVTELSADARRAIWEHAHLPSRILREVLAADFGLRIQFADGFTLDWTGREGWQSWQGDPIDLPPVGEGPILRGVVE